jgi:predicted metalloprotease with PDZ domain
MTFMVVAAALVLGYSVYLWYEAPGDHGFHALLAQHGTQIRPTTNLLGGARTVALETPRPVRLGIDGIEVSPALAQKLGYPYVGGVFIGGVTPGTAAEMATLQRGDILVGVNGQAVQDRRTLSALMAQCVPGQVVPISVWRTGSVRSLAIRF